MAIVSVDPIQTVSIDNRDIAYFDNITFSFPAAFAGATVMAGQLAGFYPNGIAADTFRLNLPQFPRSKYVRIELRPQLVLRVQAPTVALRNDLLNFGNSTGQNIYCDGVPYHLTLTPDNPNIFLAKQSLQTIEMNEMRTTFNVDPVNTSTTPWFTFDAGATSQAFLLLKSTVFFER